MAKIPYVQLSSTINTQRLAINRLIDSVGDLALLTTTAKSSLVGAVNEVDALLDSIASTQLTTPLVLTTDLTVTDSARITNNLSVGGNFDVNGLTTLDSATIDGRLTLNGTMGGTVALDSAFTSTFIRPNTIANTQLINKTITVNGVIIALGGSGVVDITDSVSSISLTRSAISAVDAGGDGSFTYDSATGIFTYTGPSATEVRAHLSGGNGLTYTTGTFAVGAGVGIKVGADDVSIDSAGIVNYASPIRALFSGGDAIKITSGVVSIDSAEITNYASPIRALFSGGSGLTLTNGTFNVGAGVGIKVGADDVAIDSAEIVNYASPIRALFSGGSGLTLTSGTFNVGAGVGIKVGADDVAIDSAGIVFYRSPIRALFSGDSNINVNTTTGAITLDSTIKINKLDADSATFTGVVNALDFNSTSDIKFKENITTLENSINTLNNIRPVSFNWIGGNKSYGVIAQELENILPELVTEDKYGIKRVSYTPIIALLIDAIKAHEIEIQKLKNCQCSCK